MIKYIGSTLEKHKGCDILDINPGAGLWSQKLHNFLQPRSHVLLEPRHDTFKSFLDPLLNAPNSKYMLVEKDPCNINTYKEMVDEGIFPHQTPRSVPDPKAQQANNTLLVTGSLAWDPKLPGFGFDSMAKQLFNMFAAAAPTNNLFHVFGLARTLFWFQQDDFSPLMADSASVMQKGNRLLEMTHNISVVVHGERTIRKTGRGSNGREAPYEIESAIRALKVGKAQGFHVPPHRRDNLYDFASYVEELSGTPGELSRDSVQDYLYEQHRAGKAATGLLQESFLEFFDLEKSMNKKYPELDLASTINSVGGKALRKRPHVQGHPAESEILKLWDKRAVVNSAHKVKAKVEATADIGEKMYHLECSALEMKDGPDKDAALKEVEELDKAWLKGLTAINRNFRTAAINVVDDRIGMRTPPYPRIQWDQRPYLSLRMHTNEVWPTNRFALISSEPIPQTSAQGLSWYEWMQDFIHSLYGTPGESIVQALDKMQHGLSDIIKDCPSLKDPKKGGRLNMRELRVRVLTVEQIEELVMAYRKWPFKTPGSDHNKFFRHKAAILAQNGRAV